MTKKEQAIEGEVVTNSDSQIQKVEKRAAAKVQTSVIAGLDINSKDLKAALDAQTQQRKLISDFIKKHLKSGVDYLRIHVVRGCPQEEKRRGSCRNGGHFSKDVLAKPGQEKIFSLFQLTSELMRDDETLQMLSGKKDLVAYKCIVKRGDVVVAEGRGAAVVGDNRRDVNATIKIAEKRARMDACLALGFSEYFAQDLDDPDYQNQRKAAEDQASARAEDGTGMALRPANAPVDDQERTVLAKWMLKRGFDTPEEQLELLRLNGIDDPKKMTSGQAREMILKVKNSSFAAPQAPQMPDDALDDFDPDADPTKALDEAVQKLESKPQPEEPELQVDDDFKAEVEQLVNGLGLNARGKQWMMQRAIGKPFAKWEKLTDKEWRGVYMIVMDITDGNIEVEDHYIAGLVEEKANVSDDVTNATVSAEVISDDTQQSSEDSEDGGQKDV